MLGRKALFTTLSSLFLTIVIATPLLAKVPQNIISQTANTVFEVVIKKPSQNVAHVYQSKISFDHLPFSVRNDPYQSIGTAFIIGPNRFVSAAHVLDLTHPTTIKAFFIRNKKGQVFRISSITRFSDYRDVIEFKVDQKQAFKDYLRLNKKPKTNSTVYAIGNALGQGIVIRKGLLTSKTDEEIDGKWKWLRFSAAASPGNSGGPLLDEEGQVIGVVLRKSVNENLNYALPVNQISKISTRIAEVTRRESIPLLNTTFNKNVLYHYKAALPASPTALNNVLTKHFDAYFQTAIFRGEHQKRNALFPFSSDAKQILLNPTTTLFPRIFIQQTSGNWDLNGPEEIVTHSLKNDGELQIGRFWNIQFFKYRMPNTHTIDDLVADSELVLDPILKATGYGRDVGSLKFYISSLGKPTMHSSYQDIYDRIWKTASWDVPFNNTQINLIYLPMPDGVIGMLINTASRYSYSFHHLRYLTHYLVADYQGTLAQWKTFQQDSGWKPHFLRTNYIRESDQALHAHTNFSDVIFKKQYIPYSDASVFTLFTWPMVFKDRQELYVHRMGLEETRTGHNDIFIGLYLKNPHLESSREDWDKISKQKHPYNNDFIEEKHFVYTRKIFDTNLSSAKLFIRINDSNKKNTAQLKSKQYQIEKTFVLYPIQSNPHFPEYALPLLRSKYLHMQTSTLNQLIQEHPNTSRLHTLNGYHYFIQKNFEKAIPEFKKAMALSPSDFLPAYYLAASIFTQGHHKQALPIAERARKLNYYDEQTAKLHIASNQELKDFKASKHLIHDLKRNAFRDEVYFHMLGEQYYQSKQFHLARSTFEKVRHLNQNYDRWNVHFTLAEIAAHMKQEKDFFYHLEETLKEGLSMSDLDQKDQLLFQSFLSTDQGQALVKKYQPTSSQQDSQ